MAKRPLVPTAGRRAAGVARPARRVASARRVPPRDVRSGRHIDCLHSVVFEERFELWSKRFSDWTDADWHDPENLSALWDLSGHLTGPPGQVLWTRGTHDINEMPKVGLPAPEFLEAADC